MPAGLQVDAALHGWDLEPVLVQIQPRAIWWRKFILRILVLNMVWFESEEDDSEQRHISV
ncbi:MAG: hypothetical protein ABJM43_21390 [Paracoccaceae bacterium]